MIRDFNFCVVSSIVVMLAYIAFHPLRVIIDIFL